MNILSRGFIKKEIVPCLSFSNGQSNCKVSCCDVVLAILKKLKSGCQWRELNWRTFFRKQYSWTSIYYHFQKWRDDGSWEKCWFQLVSKYRCKLDMSSVQLDGSHTLAKRGGEAVGYQARKKGKTTNMLFISDNQGIPLVFSEPVAGNHHDSYELIDQVEKMYKLLINAKISIAGLFLNADAGFDSRKFRNHCYANDISANIDFNKRNNTEYEDIILDEELYKNRFVIERTNAWLDAFKNLIIRYDTKSSSWKAWHYMALIVIFARRL